MQERAPSRVPQAGQSKRRRQLCCGFYLSCLCLEDVEASQASPRFTTGTVCGQVPKTWYRDGSECGVGDIHASLTMICITNKENKHLCSADMHVSYCLTIYFHSLGFAYIFFFIPYHSQIKAIPFSKKKSVLYTNVSIRP